MNGCVDEGRAAAEYQGKRLTVRLVATTASMLTASQSAYQTSFWSILSVITDPFFESGEV